MFNLISTCLGSPPEMTQMEYYDKDKVYHKLGPMTPLEFYQKLVKPLFDLEKQVTVPFLNGTCKSLQSASQFRTASSG